MSDGGLAKTRCPRINCGLRRSKAKDIRVVSWVKWSLPMLEISSDVNASRMNLRITNSCKRKIFYYDVKKLREELRLDLRVSRQAWLTLRMDVMQRTRFRDRSRNYSPCERDLAMICQKAQIFWKTARYQSFAGKSPSFLKEREPSWLVTKVGSTISSSQQLLLSFELDVHDDKFRLKFDIPWMSLRRRLRNKYVKVSAHDAH